MTETPAPYNADAKPCGLCPNDYSGICCRGGEGSTWAYYRYAVATIPPGACEYQGIFDHVVFRLPQWGGLAEPKEVKRVG